MKQFRRWSALLQAGWILACLYVLARTLALRNGDAQEAELLLMLGLSFPSGWIATGILLAFMKISHWEPTLAFASLFLVWLLYFLTGWLQWFLVVPAIFRGIRRKYKHNHEMIDLFPKE